MAKDVKEDSNKNKTCSKCGYKWLSRINNPKRCPNLKCTAWLTNTMHELVEEPKPIKKIIRGEDAWS